MSDHLPYYVELVATDEIGRTAQRNFSAKQIEKAAAVLRCFGFTQPVIVDENRNIISGHLLFWAALERGYQRVPILQVPKSAACRIGKGR
jgi:ParB-like chromosome segregation protein Spo0J